MGLSASIAQPESTGKITVVRLANVVVGYVDGLELVAVQEVLFSCTCCLDSEEDLEEVCGVVVHGDVFFFEMFVFFGIGVLFRKRYEVFRKKNTIPIGSRFRKEAHRHVESTPTVVNTAVCS